MIFSEFANFWKRALHFYSSFHCDAKNYIMMSKMARRIHKFFVASYLLWNAFFTFLFYCYIKLTRRSNLLIENKSVFLSNINHKRDSNLLFIILLLPLLLPLLLLVKESNKNLLFSATESSSVAYFTIVLWIFHYSIDGGDTWGPIFHGKADFSCSSILNTVGLRIHSRFITDYLTQTYTITISSLPTLSGPSAGPILYFARR
jgi:hypothetical protein